LSASRCDVWAVALWKHYLPSIANGAPFYLAADSLLVRELYSKDLGGTGGVEAALSDFHESCLMLLDTTSTRTVIRRGALLGIPGQVHSRAICLAVQQVLVVERMLHDEQDSEQSYFPRYREVLGISEFREHSNPMSRAAFQEIWNVLARELRAVQGAGPGTITFAAGKGKDVNRSFPLSQALFTAHDLTVIRDKCPTLEQTTPDRVLLIALLRERVELGVRARKLLTAAATDEIVAQRLCAQVRSFLANDVLLSLRRSWVVTREAGVIVAYLERADAFDFDNDSDRFSLYHRSESEQSTGAALEQVVERRLSAALVVFLVPDADGFREWRRDDNLDDADSVLAVMRTINCCQFEAQVARLGGPKFVPTESNLPARFALLACSGGIGSHINALLGVPRPAKRIELVGGLLADARSRVFLGGYPPVGIRYDARALAGEDHVLVGGVHRRVSDFLDALRNQTEESCYTIQVGDAGLRFSVAARKQALPSTVRLGYALHDGELSLVPGPVEEGQPGLRGTQLTDKARLRALGLGERDIRLLMRRGKRLAVCEVDLALLVGELRVLEKSHSLASLVARQIVATRSIPLGAATSGLLRRLQAARHRDSVRKAT
jgi:hypothetical protein